MAVYAIRRYPLEVGLRDGSKVVLRPMEAADGDRLLEFFHRIPEEERFFLKDDVTSPDTVKGWTEHLDYDRALPLLAFDGGRVVADAVLIRHRGGYRAHTGELRVVIDPDYRDRGLGVRLFSELTDVAWDAELDNVEFELVSGVQEVAMEAAEHVGAFRVGTLSDFVKDQHGHPHDLVVLRIPLGKWWQWSRF